MKPVHAAAVSLAFLSGCAAPQPAMVNYGHPALNQPAPSGFQNDPGRVAVGTVAGGIIGSQLGGGNGRLVGTAVGAATGAMMSQGQYTNDAAVGAAIGGIIGSRFGGGNGRAAATAIGAGLGAFMAVPRQEPAR